MPRLLALRDRGTDTREPVVVGLVRRRTEDKQAGSCAST